MTEKYSACRVDQTHMPLTFWESALTTRPQGQLSSHWSLIQVIQESTAHYTHLYFGETC